MTISQDPQAPLVVVCGATGIQGGSVIKALAESDRAYRFRGLTRNASKPVAQALAQRGVEIFQVDLSVENEPNVAEAFKGANISFVVTNFWEHQDKHRETSEGQMLVRVSKTVGVDLLVWSGLESPSELSGGKYTHVAHFDAKAAVTQYAHDIGIPFVNVQAGCYSINYTEHWRPRKQDDGSYVIKLPYNLDDVCPMIDMVSDYGLFVREAIEQPAFGAGTDVLSCGEIISFRDAVAQLAKITGKNIRIEQITAEQFATGARISAIYAENMRLTLHEYGWYGKKDIGPSLEHLARRPRTWAEFVQEQDWDAIMG